MNGYESRIPRIAIGVAAIALSAITLGLTVFLPASVNSERYESALLAAAKAAAPSPVEVAIIPARIDVVGNCEETVAFEPARQAQRKVDQHT
jgi:hypothetical protein